MIRPTQLIKSILFWGVSVILTSCATIFSGTTANVTINGDIDEPLTIVSSYGEYHDVTLPVQIKVKRRRLDGQHISITSNSCDYPDIVLEKDINLWALCDLGFYMLPLGVDLLTNAVSKPKEDFFYIKADSVCQSVNVIKMNKLRREAVKETRMKYLNDPSNLRRHEIGFGFGLGDNQADHDMHQAVDKWLLPYPALSKEFECFDLFGDSYVCADINYHYRLNRKWAIGATMAWGHSEQSYIDNSYYITAEVSSPDSQLELVSGNNIYRDACQSCRFFAAAPSVNYTWYESKHNRFYSELSLGAMRHHLTLKLNEYHTDEFVEGNGVRQDAVNCVTEKFDKIIWRTACQLTALGYSVGSGPLRFYADLGYGYLGVAHFGLRLNF